MYRWFLVISTLFIVLIALFLLDIFRPELTRLEVISSYLLDLKFVAGIFAMLIGAAVGTIELIGRYRDAPFEALAVGSAFLYITVNAIISLMAFIGLLIYFPDYADATNQLTDLIEAAAIAGFGSLAIMRTSIVKTQINDKEVSVGPAIFIDTLLKAADRGVDRHRAIKRLNVVPNAMIPIAAQNYSIEDLWAICDYSLQNLEVAERNTLDQKIKLLTELSTRGVHPEIIKYLGGMQLQQIIGTEAFEQACAVIKSTKMYPLSADENNSEQDKTIADQDKIISDGWPG